MWRGQVGDGDVARAITKKETVIFHLYVRSYGLDAHASKFFQKKVNLTLTRQDFFPKKWTSS